MKLLSLNGESVEINIKDSQVLIFDMLYIEDLKAHNKLFEVSNKSIKEIENEIFEWSDGSLLGFYSLKFDCSSVNIHIKDIKYWVLI